MCRLKLVTLSLLFTIPFLATSQGDRSANNQLQIPAADQAFYKVIVDYSLFRPLGWRPPDTSPKYELIATKIPATGKAKALIRESRSNKTYYVGIGDQLQETKVDKIAANQVGLVLEGKPISLSINSIQFLNTGGGKRGKRGRGGKSSKDGKDGKDENAERKSEGRSGNERRGRGGGRGSRGRGGFDSQRAQDMRARWQNSSPEERQKMIEGFRQRFGGGSGRRGR